MQLSCPKCGTRDVRVARRNGAGEYLRGLLGVYPMRCRHCKTRWETSAWENSAWKYAHCPKCYRQELSTWSEQYYHPPFWTRVHLQLGATPYRCAACRCNFTSFKKCKERFSWRHKERASTAQTTAQTTAPVASKGQEEVVGPEVLPNKTVKMAASHGEALEMGALPSETLNMGASNMNASPSETAKMAAEPSQILRAEASPDQRPTSQTPK